MNSPFLQEFLKRKAESLKSSKKPTPSMNPLPGPKLNSIRAFADSKPTAKQVEAFFRDKIEVLNRAVEAEES